MVSPEGSCADAAVRGRHDRRGVHDSAGGLASGSKGWGDALDPSGSWWQRRKPVGERSCGRANDDRASHRGVAVLCLFKDLDRRTVLRRAKILVPGQGNEDLVSVAGLLALGSYPQEHFPQLMVTFVHYPTETGAQSPAGDRFLDNVTLEGPVPVMARDTLAAIRRNMSRRAVIAGADREDIWEYPETALREAIVNALVHRDLSSGARGTQIQVEMYPDRLVIRNPGGLFGLVTIDNLGEEGISSARNATLIKILEDIPLPGETRTVCENRGSDIRSKPAIGPDRPATGTDIPCRPPSRPAHRPWRADTVASGTSGPDRARRPDRTAMAYDHAPGRNDRTSW